MQVSDLNCPVIKYYIELENGNFVVHLYAKPGALDPKLGHAGTSMVQDEWNVG
jgi:hypothetical protein